MPIIRIQDKLLFYAHVPKAGGTSVADFLQQMGGKVAFVYGEYWRKKPKDRWPATSPQHIDAEALQELFPLDFFDHVFTVVRHPEDRIISEYMFRRGRSRIHAALGFSEWLHLVVAASKVNAFVFDSHVRPQVDIVPANTRFFQLEQGLGDLSDWLSSVLGSEKGFTFKQHSNRSEYAQIRLTAEDRRLINAFYEDDFMRFGYEPRDASLAAPASVMGRLRCACCAVAGSVLTFLLSWRIPY